MNYIYLQKQKQKKKQLNKNEKATFWRNYKKNDVFAIVCVHFANPKRVKVSSIVIVSNVCVIL